MARLVFDLDGTLVHSTPTMTAAANTLLAELGRAPLPEPVVAGFVGHGVRRLVERLLAHTGGAPDGEVELSVARYRAIYFADPVTGTEPYAGAPEALDALARAGHGLAVCTQKPDAPALEILRRLGLMPPITGFAGGDGLGVLKPDPRLFRHAADQLAPGPAIMIGDNATDAATARNAGAPFVMHTMGYNASAPDTFGAQATFADFAELPALIAGMVAEAR